MLSEQQRRSYLEAPHCCPFCGSDNINALGARSTDDDGIITDVVRCEDCKKEWRDVYTLTDVQEIEEEE